MIPVAVVLIGAIIGSAALSGGAPKKDLKVSVDVYETTCDELRNNSNHYAGEEVTVRDQDANVIGKGVLNDPTDDSEYDSTDSLVDTCTLYSTVNVPSDRSVYRVSSSGASNPVSFDATELKDSGWHANITAGY